jgi:hypothetical protein
LALVVEQQRQIAELTALIEGLHAKIAQLPATRSARRPLFQGDARGPAEGSWLEGVSFVLIPGGIAKGEIVRVALEMKW